VERLVPLRVPSSAYSVSWGKGHVILYTSNVCGAVAFFSAARSPPGMRLALHLGHEPHLELLRVRDRDPDVLDRMGKYALEGDSDALLVVPEQPRPPDTPGGSSGGVAWLMTASPLAPASVF
jgi:hypothetical protein